MTMIHARVNEVIANCGCGDSNCGSCFLFFPSANCGDDSCSSCVCVIPAGPDRAVILIAQGDALIALHAHAGRIEAVVLRRA